MTSLVPCVAGAAFVAVLQSVDCFRDYGKFTSIVMTVKTAVNGRDVVNMS